MELLRDVVGMSGGAPPKQTAALIGLGLASEGRGSGSFSPIPSLPASFKPPVNTNGQGSSSNRSRPGVWRLCAFKNAAREGEGLRLVRWQRLTAEQHQQLQQQQLLLQQQQLPHMQLNDRLRFFEVDEETEFIYAKFHKKICHPKITKVVYAESLKDLDESWSEEETLLLWGLCEEFELRWAVVWDRFRDRSPNPRTLEDLKKRYFAVAKAMTARHFDEKIAKAQQENAGPAVLQRLKEEKARHPLSRFTYNVIAERQRRQLLEQRQRVSVELQQQQQLLQQQIQYLELDVRKCSKSREEQRKLLRRFEVPTEDIVAEPVPLLQFSSPTATMLSSVLQQQQQQLPKRQAELVEKHLASYNAHKPTCNSFPVVEAYTALRGDVSVLVALKMHMEKLKAELDFWEESVAAAQQPPVAAAAAKQQGGRGHGCAGSRSKRGYGGAQGGGKAATAAAAAAAATTPQQQQQQAQAKQQQPMPMGEQQPQLLQQQQMLVQQQQQQQQGQVKKQQALPQQQQQQQPHLYQGMQHTQQQPSPMAQPLQMQQRHMQLQQQQLLQQQQMMQQQMQQQQMMQQQQPYMVPVLDLQMQQQQQQQQHLLQQQQQHMMQQQQMMQQPHLMQPHAVQPQQQQLLQQGLAPHAYPAMGGVMPMQQQQPQQPQQQQQPSKSRLRRIAQAATPAGGEGSDVSQQQQQQGGSRPPKKARSARRNNQ